MARRLRTILYTTVRNARGAKKDDFETDQVRQGSAKEKKKDDDDECEATKNRERCQQKKTG